MKQLLATILVLFLILGCSKSEEKKDAINYPKSEMVVSDTTDSMGGDLKLSITSINENDSSKVFKVISSYKGLDVGLNVSVPSEDKKSKSGFGSGIILSSNEASDNFLQALKKVYGSKVEGKKFVKNISVNFVDLDAMAAQLGASSNSNSDEKQYKLFFEKESDVAEMYLNINEKQGWIELKEKDSEYRDSIIKFLSVQK
jgi:hypothetical protein